MANTVVNEFWLNSVNFKNYKSKSSICSLYLKIDKKFKVQHWNYRLLISKDILLNSLFVYKI